MPWKPGTGMTRAGGVDLPGEVAGLVVLDELVVHGWDVASVSGQDYICDEPSLEVVHGFVSQFSGPGNEEARDRPVRPRGRGARGGAAARPGHRHDRPPTRPGPPWLIDWVLAPRCTGGL